MACDTSLAVVSGMAFEAALAQGPSIHTVYGLHPPKLMADMEDAIKKGAAGLLSFGTAAGLLPTLASGTVVIARRVWSKHGIFTASEAWAAELCRQLPGAVYADIAGVDAPLVSVQEKSLLHADSGAAIADMESHHVARMAQRHSLPFAALRIVLDSAHRALPPAAMAAARADGTIDYAAMLGSLLAQPRQLPALMLLGADQARAKKALLRCGHLLKGSLFGFVNGG